MKYKVYGTIEHNFTVIVDAEGQEEANERALACAEDGMVELGDPVDDAEITKIEEL